MCFLPNLQKDHIWLSSTNSSMGLLINMQRVLFSSLETKVRWFPWAWWVGLPSTVKTPHRRHNIMLHGPSNHQYTHFKTSCLIRIFGNVKVVVLASTVLHIHQKWGISLPLANETIFQDNCTRYNTKKNTNLPHNTLLQSCLLYLHYYQSGV
jgi:hypothetical protein